MAQLCLYLDSETIKKIEAMAKANQVSVSKWVRENLKESLTNTWPRDYFNLFGCINDNSFKKAQPLPFTDKDLREAF